MRWIARETGESAARPREILLAGLAFSVAVAAALYPQVLNAYGVPDLGDPLFSMWRIAWVTHQIVNDPKHLFDANIFYPERGTLTYSDSMLLPGLVGAPFIWLGVPLAITYQILLLGSFVLSGLALYVFARAVGMAPAAAWIGGLVFTLSPYRFAHYSHLELLVMPWMPLALLAVYRLLTRGGLRYAVYLALSLAAQWYSSMYYGVFLTVFTAVFVAAFAAAQRSGWRRFAVATVSVAASLVLVVPLAQAYASTAGARGVRPKAVVQVYSATPLEYLQPHHRSRWYWEIYVVGRMPERELFTNIAPLALAAGGLVGLPLPAHRVAALAAGLVAFDGSLGMNGLWYGHAYEHLAAFKSMRVPARFAALVSLTLALLAAAGAANVLALARSRTHMHLIAAALTVICLVEASPRLELTPVWRRPPGLYGHVRGLPDAVLFEYPVHGVQDFDENLPYMYFSTWHWTRMVNGYSGNSPRSYAELVDGVATFPRDESVDHLRSAGVTHVTVHCALWYPEPCELTMKRLDADARFRLLTRTTWEGKPALLYELLK